jgi:hypothetical protein
MRTVNLRPNNGWWSRYRRLFFRDDHLAWEFILRSVCFMDADSVWRASWASQVWQQDTCGYGRIKRPLNWIWIFWGRVGSLTTTPRRGAEFATRSR